MKDAAMRIVPILAGIAAILAVQIALGAEPEIAAGPQWWPGTGTTNFVTPEAACNSTQFQQAYLGTSSFLFDHAGPRNDGDKRKWCWYVIVDNDSAPRAITVVSPICPVGSQLGANAKAGGEASRCVCNAGLSYDADARQCVLPKPVNGKTAKK